MFLLDPETEKAYYSQKIEILNSVRRKVVPLWHFPSNRMVVASKRKSNDKITKGPMKEY